ncbi:hypothetical protein GCM10018790_77360 [Kitasatospora xanthocidica]|uniref:hypothetical protein n=1 Tax=Kitasatospora xanthocidica TaxID=83382 RepID=UPI001679BB22|nr:hypothetical protein [Kitasatospora xanthocidica]GHF88466.1 hypothetical protein GCM10018790_77360 [Kitasatospora xanthocidica]
MHADTAAPWYRMADLLPEAAAQHVKDCWDTGEQESGLGLLVEGLIARQVPVGGADRALLSVLAEQWGLRERLTPGILRCLGDGGPAPVRLLDDDADGAEPVTGLGGPELAGLVLAPWIGCNRCGRLLLRAHTWEPWDDFSHRAEHYVIATPGRDRVLRVLPADAAGEAFAELLDGCPGV